MKRLFFGSTVAAATLVAAVWLVRMPPDVQQTGTPAGDGTSISTPRTADGKPDLSGLWTAGGVNNAQVDALGNVTITLAARDASPINFERDSGLRQRADANKPIYKPEFWDKVQHLDENGNAEDPTFSCMPAGVPRIGAPDKILQTATEITLLYQNRNTFRVIPVDGRPHHPEKSLDQTWMGDSVGHWEGDTLVVDTIGFNDVSWLDWPGYFHSEQMRVTERLRREGNTLHYQATVEDPVVLMKPWVRNPVTRKLNTDPNATLLEDLPCDERDLKHLVTKERG
jgi:hypothetical protein